MTLAAGELRHRITLQKRESSQDPVTGESVFNWVDVAKVSASVTPLSVREFIASKSEQSEVSARVKIRYREDVNAQMRILFRNKIYNILGVLPDPDSGLEYITLPVSEGVSIG